MSRCAMRMAELSETTGVAIATLKYYLREGLLHPGESLNRTQASYDDSHVDRVRLIRALVESGGLSLARAHDVVRTLEEPPESRHMMLGVAQHALTPPPPGAATDDWTQVAREFVTHRGWLVDVHDDLLVILGDQLRAMVSAGVALEDPTDVDRWASAVEQIAVVDLDTIPDEPSAALRQVVVGTVLSDQVLLTLRRLAQQHESARRAGAQR